jgi:hypothetical protein
MPLQATSGNHEIIAGIMLVPSLLGLIAPDVANCAFSCPNPTFSGFALGSGA